MPEEVTPRVCKISTLERMAIRGGIGSAFALAVLGLILGHFALPGGGIVSAAMISVVPVTCIIYFVGWSRRRRELLDSDLRRCLSCHQDLRGLANSGICPECGEAYEIDAVRDAWEREYPSLRLRHQEPP